MIPLCVPNLAGREAEYLAKCVETTFVSSVGQFVNTFERMVAEATGAAGAVATASGTTALHAALVAIGVRHGDLVPCPSLTFIASCNAISHAGATPWLFDVDPGSWTLDPALLARALATESEWNGSELRHKATGRRVSAIVPVFTLGAPCDMDAINEVARTYRLPVVVDAAAALGATYKGKPCGDVGADLVMISFNGNKTVTCGGGGAIVGQNGDLLRKVRHLTTTARVGADYDHDVVGFNYRMTNLQAAVGCAQMENLDRFVAAKRRIAAAYDNAFQALPATSRFPVPNWAQSANWFSGFVMDGADGAGRSASLRTFLCENGIDARPFWKPMHQQPPYRDAPRTPMPVCEDLWERIVTLPCSTHLTEADQTYVCDAVHRWFAASLAAASEPRRARA
jgi:dTDP-4-amino-4,6-dideoxygalactose transaminase